MSNTLLLLLPLFIYLIVVIPIVVHISKKQFFRSGNRTFWIAMVIIFNIFGALAYFTIGRGDE